MPRVRDDTRSTPQPTQTPPSPPGLPLRWAVIALTAGLASAIGLATGGPIAAVTAGAAVAMALHKLLA